MARAVDRLLASPESLVRVGFTGGEPLLAFPLIRRTIGYVESKRRPGQEVRYKVLTNGLLADADVVRFLAEREVDVQVSLDGGPDVHEERSPGSFERIERLFAMLRRRFPRYLEQCVSVNATVTPGTSGRLADSVSRLMATGAGTIGVSPAKGVAAASASQMAELDRQLGLVSREMRRHYDKTRQVPFAPFRKPFPPVRYRRVGPWYCAAPSNRGLTVDADGTLSACLMASRTYAPAPPAGLRAAVAALRRLPLGAPNGGETRREKGFELFLRSGGRYSSRGACASCRWRRECRICPLAAAADPAWRGGSRRVPEFLCAFNAVLLKHRERFPPQPPRHWFD